MLTIHIGSVATVEISKGPLTISEEEFTVISAAGVVVQNELI